MRTASLLAALVDQPQGITAAALAQRLDIPKSTLSLILRHFLDLGIVERAHDRAGVVIGPELVKLAFRIVSNLQVPRVARPHLEWLARETHENVYLGVQNGLRAIYIDRVDGTESVRVNVELGAARPLHATALGKLILAFPALPPGCRPADGRAPGDDATHHYRPDSAETPAGGPSETGVLHQRRREHRRPLRDCRSRDRAWPDRRRDLHFRARIAGAAEPAALGSEDAEGCPAHQSGSHGSAPVQRLGPEPWRLGPGEAESDHARPRRSAGIGEIGVPARLTRREPWGRARPLCAVPARTCLRVEPFGLDEETAALAQPMAIAAHSTRRGRLAPGAPAWY